MEAARAEPIPHLRRGLIANLKGHATRSFLGHAEANFPSHVIPFNGLTRRNPISDGFAEWTATVKFSKNSRYPGSSSLSTACLLFQWQQVLITNLASQLILNMHQLFLFQVEYALLGIYVQTKVA